jgi:methionyl-tRNA formyltransferase
MKIIFMGTPDFAVPALRALVAAGHQICAVYTQPPRPANRGKQPTPSAVQRVAEEYGLLVRSPTSLKSAEAQAEFAVLGADIAVVAAYGLILPQAVLDAPTHGCLNIHGSILPRWRGAAPVQRAILAGDSETGVAIMQMEAGLDTGPVRALRSTAIAHKTTGDLLTELAQMGADLLLAVLDDLDGHPPVPQSTDGVLHAPKIDKSEAEVDFMISAVQVERQVRAFAPAPGAWFAYAGERFKILAADVLPPDGSSAARPGLVLDDVLTIGCNPGRIRITRIQRAGKGAMDAADLLRGFPIPAGTILD